MRAELAGRKGSFVQVGATRDGIDPYLDCARRRALPAVLIETPRYLQWRRKLDGRRAFDLEIAISRPDDPTAVAHALESAGVAPALILAGFERYTSSAVKLARKLSLPPWPSIGENFTVPTKEALRRILRGAGAQQYQPDYTSFNASVADQFFSEFSDMAYPLVVKPVDGAGGIGVFLASDPQQLKRAVELIGQLRNYGGGEFDRLLIEEFAVGVEYSVQGFSHQGEAQILTFCEKITSAEFSTGTDLVPLREIGHICAPGSLLHPGLRSVVEQCVLFTGYKSGPFHVDFIAGLSGPKIIEMGFRLSGSHLVSVIERVVGLQWAEIVFESYLGREAKIPTTESCHRVVGQIHLQSDAEFSAAENLKESCEGVELTRFPPSPEMPISEALRADWLLYTSWLGRLTVSGGEIDDVREKLKKCMTAHGRNT